MLSSYGNHRLRNDTEVDTMNSRIFEFVQKCLQDARKDFGCEVEVLVPKDIAREIGIEPTPLWIARAVAKRRLLALFVGYDPTMEILTAIEDTRARRENLNRFHEYLWGNRPVDLLIRTGGYQVLSGFLPLATSYSRLFFLRELFNDVPTAAFEAIVGQFLNVPRLYGS